MLGTEIGFSEEFTFQGKFPSGDQTAKDLKEIQVRFISAQVSHKWRQPGNLMINHTNIQKFVFHYTQTNI